MVEFLRKSLHFLTGREWLSNPHLSTVPRLTIADFEKSKRSGIMNK
jgi:hypothetical protein